MFNKRLAALGLVLIAVAGVTGARRHITRPRPRSGIPARSYQFRSRSQPKTALSRSALLLERPARGNIPRRQIRLFQLDTAKLQIEHCSISRVALQLYDDGTWVLSLRADQNPHVEGEGQQPTTEDGKYTLNLKRNQFSLEVRCYGNFQVKEADPNAAAGKPVLYNLRPKQFWVQSGQPYHFWQRGFSKDVADYFEIIDRVEIEFAIDEPTKP